MGDVYSARPVILGERWGRLATENEPIDRDVARQRQGLGLVGYWRGEATVGKIWAVEYMECLERVNVWVWLERAIIWTMEMLEITPTLLGLFIYSFTF